MKSPTSDPGTTITEPMLMSQVRRVHRVVYVEQCVPASELWRCRNLPYIVAAIM
jgi:hypothetical protein